MPRSLNVTLIGAGVVGRSWALVFQRADLAVTVFDPSDTALDLARTRIADALVAQGRSLAATRISFASDLGQALAGADYVQESAPEALEIKRAIYARIAPLMPAGCVLGSSTSAISPTALFDGLPGAERFLVAHPTNPPHLLPAVELVPSPWTSAAAMGRATDVLETCGQSVIRLKREIPGFVVNRLQAALIEAALQLVADDVADPDDIDKAVRDALGLRWAFVGPFETMDLNSDDGFGVYVSKYGATLQSLSPNAGPGSAWHSKAPGKVEAARRAILPVEQVPARQAWRNRNLALLRDLKDSGSDRGSA